MLAANVSSVHWNVHAVPAAVVPLDLDGNPLQCVAGVCLLPSCRPGEPACGCRPDETCDDGASCEEDVCIPAGCEDGEENCRCVSGGTCDVGFFCRDGVVCVDETGHEGGPCLSNNLCHPGNRCDADRQRCEFCDLGTQGCACTDEGTCADGLGCSAGLCVSGELLPPDNPLCYTPCRRDLPEGADTRTCSADGLLEGCIDDQSCVRGSCVAPGDEPPSCTSEIDCPFFQTCLDGVATPTAPRAPSAHRAWAVISACAVCRVHSELGRAPATVVSAATPPMVKPASAYLQLRRRPGLRTCPPHRASWWKAPAHSN